MDKTEKQPLVPVLIDGVPCRVGAGWSGVSAALGV